MDRFRPSFHDGQIVDLRLGPRRELTIVAELPPGSTRTDSTAARPIVRIRFGTIENFQEVDGFIGRNLRQPAPDRYWAEIVRLNEHAKSASGHRSFRLEMEPGGTIEIVCRHVAVENVIRPGPEEP